MSEACDRSPAHVVGGGAGMSDMCFIHGVDEPLLPGDFRVCCECGHVWRTPAAYLIDVASLVAEMQWPMPRDLDKDDLPFCPLCSHDW